MQKKLILFLFFYIFSQNSSAILIKLNCTVSSKFTSSNGLTSSSSGKALVDIEDSTIKKYITITSDDENINNFSFLSTRPTNKNYINLSNENKWDLSTDIQFSESLVVSQHIVIDRNSGNLFLSSTTYRDGKQTSTSASGNCEKINESSKKF